MEEKYLLKRLEILENLGGLPEPNINNSEWLYILGEETRNSIMIEGYFVEKQELEKVLADGKPLTKSQQEAVRYFDTAKFVYGLAYEYYRDRQFWLDKALVRQINKGLGFNGDFRKIRIKIAGSKVQPPDFDIDRWIDIYLKFIKVVFHSETDFFRLLAVSHSFFEYIHPFIDGNGRTGRILLNYILISKGFPPVIIKAETQRDKYYKGLEEVDKQIEPIFTEKNFLKEDKSLNFLKTVSSKILKDLITSSIRENIDRVILDIIEKSGEKLLPLSKVETGYSATGLRQMVSRGKIVAVKRGKVWLSAKNPILVL